MNENKQYFASKDEYYLSKIRTLKAENEELKAQILERSYNNEYVKCYTEVLDYIRYSKDCAAGREILDIFKKHFA